MKTMILSTIFAAAFLLGCAKNDENTAASTTNDVTLSFKAKVGNSDFACGSTYPNAVGSVAIVARDFRFYVHDIRLVKSDNTEVSLTLNQDGTWQYQNVALLDFENGTGGCADTTAPTTATNSQVKGTIPQSGGVAFTKIKFRLGVPQNLNHLDVGTASAPLNLSSLHWTWTAGYKFARLDFRTSGGQYDTSAFNIHLGSVSCTGTAPNITCTYPNRPEITLNIPAAYQASLSALANMQLVADVRELVQDLDLTVADQGAAAGCMSGQGDPECRHVMTRFGLEYAYTGTTATSGNRDATNGTTYSAQTGGHATQVSAQSFFRAE